MPDSAGFGQDSSPRRRRHGADPRRPYQAGGPSTLEARAETTLDLTSQCSPLTASTSGIRKDPVGVRSLDTRDHWKRRTSAWTLGAESVSPRSRRPSMLAVEHRQTRQSRTTVRTSRGPPSPITSSAWRSRRNADTHRHPATADWTRPITHMTPDPAVLPPPSRQKRRERHWKCAGIHNTLDARSPGCPGALAPQPSSARWRRQNRRERRPSAAVGERSPDSVRPLDRRKNGATGYVDVATDADPAGLEPPRR
jgi:hypothetical protein